jgi:Stress responsive A/B Barrel Domain
MARKDMCMPKITRRALIRSGSIAASFATFTPVNLNGVVAKENQNGKVFHVFAFQWKPGASEVEKDRAAKEIAAFQGTIPGLLETHVGPNISPRGKGYTFGGIMLFKDKAALDAYFQHPTHLALVKWLVPLIDAIELDLRG